MTDIVERLRTDLPRHDVTISEGDKVAVLRRYAKLEADNARLRAALAELAGDETYIENLSEWHDTGKMRDGVQRIARAALEAKDA